MHALTHMPLAGIIPRVVQQLFEEIEKQEAAGQWKFSVTVSYLEIYNDKVYDLLEFKDTDLPIREDQQKNILIPGLIEVCVWGGGGLRVGDCVGGWVSAWVWLWMWV
jgi:hypothetical protein